MLMVLNCNVNIRCKYYDIDIIGYVICYNYTILGVAEIEVRYYLSSYLVFPFRLKPMIPRGAYEMKSEKITSLLSKLLTAKKR